MSTLCQITCVDDEKAFFESIKKHGTSRHCSGGGWGRFKGEIPPIHSTLVLDLDSERQEYFRVIYTELWLKSKGYDRAVHPSERDEWLSEGNLTVQLCHVYVIKC